MDDCSGSARWWKYKPPEGVISEYCMLVDKIWEEFNFLKSLLDVFDWFILFCVSMIYVLCMHSQATFYLLRPEDNLCEFPPSTCGSQ